MDRDRKFGWGLVGIGLAAVAGVAVLAPALAAPGAEPCCFANDRVQGTCTVIPGEGETCGSILSYLNNPMSTGKSYCGGTSLRGGWAQVDCTSGKSAIQKGTAGPTAKARNALPARVTGASR